MTDGRNKRHKKTIKPRYKFFTNVARLLTFPIVKFVYRAKVEKFKDRRKRNYLILFNHQTPFDQFFIALAIKGAAFIVASEDVTSNGLLSKALTYAFPIIPIKKQSNDVKAVINCVRAAKAGASIVLSPEGNRTYSGETSFIKPSIAALVRTLKLPVAFFLIEGGYGAEPRWSNVVRKGKVRCAVKSVLEYEDYKDLSDDEIYAVIKERLYRFDAADDQSFRSRKSAEKLERLLYVCPECGFSEFSSNGRTVACKRCGKSAEYGDDLKFYGDFPFSTVRDWYAFQERFVSEANLDAFKNTPAFTDTVRLSEVVPYKRKRRMLSGAELGLYCDRMEFSDEKRNIVYSFDDVTSATVLGRNKLNFYVGSEIFQIKGKKTFNAVKYLHFYYVYKQKKAGKQDDFFFGI